MSPSLPPTTTLPHSPDTTLTVVLDILFEPSPTLHALTLPILRSTPFPTYNTLITAIGAQLTALANASDPAKTATLDRILSSHPRLGAKKVDSELSRGEQASLEDDQGREEANEAHDLAALNRDYESKFEGLRYVVFVNARPRSTILQNMRERIARADMHAERLDAIQAMCNIASDRAAKLPREI